MEHLKKYFLFSNLSVTKKNYIIKYCSLEKFIKGQIVYNENDKFNDKIFYIIEGEFLKQKL